MNKVEKLKREYLKAIKLNPANSDLLNDYAMFLYRYKNDYNNATKLLGKAIKLNPYNNMYKYNYNKIISGTNSRFDNYHNFLVLVIIGIMAWLSFNGYHNFLNMFLLFTVAQIVMNYQKNLSKKYN